MKFRKLSGLAAVPVGLLMSGLLVVGASSAAFTAQTATGDNTWSTGEITLTNDRPGEALFEATDILPGASDSQDVEVTFTGDLASTITLSAAPGADVADDLADHIMLGITDSEAGSIFDGTLAEFDLEGADLDWVTASAEEIRTFTIAWSFDPAAEDHEAVMGGSVSLAFVWEATTIATGGA